MKIEKIISKISATVAAIVILIFTTGMYLSAKGFVFQGDKIYLVNQAHAAQSSTHITLASNIALPSGHILGKKDAPVTIYEFSSYKCSYCARFHLNTLPKIKKEFIDTGKAKLVFINFPLDAGSMKAAIISQCIPQENYYPFINTMFENQRKISTSEQSTQFLQTVAQQNGLSKEKFDECLKNTAIAQNILDTRQDAISNIKITGTPSFVIKTPTQTIFYPQAISFDKISEILNKN